MLYRGFSKTELSRIEPILKQFNIQYNITSDLHEAKNVDEAVKQEIRTRPVATRDSAFYQIEIEKDEFQKLSPEAAAKLLDLRIYEEHESPFTEEELQNMGEISHNHFEPKKKEQTKSEKMIGYIILVAILIGATIYLKNFMKKFNTPPAAGYSFEVKD